MFKEIVAATSKTSRLLFIFLIKCYQTIISPFLGPRCRFYPSCSHYAIDALRHRGVVVGFLLIGKRILRCHPFSLGGYDPVPKQNKLTKG